MSLEQKIIKYFDQHPELKQGYIAEKAGVSHATLIALLKGKRQIRTNTVNKVAQALGIKS